MKVKEESEKADLKLNIKKAKIMASGPKISWQVDGETVETVADFSWAPKSLQMVTAAMKLKKCLLLERKAMTTILKIWQYIKKQRHYSANKGPYSQSYGFSRVGP